MKINTLTKLAAVIAVASVDACAQQKRIVVSIPDRTMVVFEGGRVLKIFYATQPAVNPPLFVFVCTDPEKVPTHYKRFLENVLRQEFDFEGVPLTFQFRPRSAGEDVE